MSAGQDSPARRVRSVVSYAVAVEQDSRLMHLTPYMISPVAAERALEELKPEHPAAHVVERVRETVVDDSLSSRPSSSIQASGRQIPCFSMEEAGRLVDAGMLCEAIDRFNEDADRR
jgi:hypothetical protein